MTVFALFFCIFAYFRRQIPVMFDQSQRAL
jgi:hypothetical protein